jgi:hypothetical protein
MVVLDVPALTATIHPHRTTRFTLALAGAPAPYALHPPCLLHDSGVQHIKSSLRVTIIRIRCSRTLNLLIP